MASGIGVTPMRALLEELSQQPGDVTLIHRVRDPGSALFSEELAELARVRGATALTVPGSRLRTRPSWLPESAAHLSDVEALRHLVPDVAERDVFVCGSPQWMDHVVAAAEQAGVPREHVHVERFSY